MIGLGFVGLGGMGVAQVKAFIPHGDGRIVAGADPAPEARRAFADLAPEAAVYEDARDLLSDRRVDAVVVVVPTHLHKTLVLDALRTGRPVLVEKPMAMNVAECQEMNEAADRARRLLMVAHCRRFDADWGAFARTYIAGELGERILWRLVRGGVIGGKWFMDEQCGRGPLFDGAVHNYDFANWIFGPAESVVGSSIKLDPSCTAIDTGNAIVRYRNGSELLLSWSWSKPAAFLHDALGTRNTFVFGSGGLDLPQGSKGHTLIGQKGDKQLIPFAPNDMYVDQARHFLDCVNGSAVCKIPGTEAIKAVAVGEAVLQACREGGIVKVV
jgi:predicted dehydrogenase